MKGQSAIEYLITYGWMLLAVAIVGSAIFAVVSGNQPGLETEGFDSGSLSVTGEGYEDHFLQLGLRNEGRDKVEVQRVKLSGNGVYKDVMFNTGVAMGQEEIIRLPGVTSSEDDEEEYNLSVSYGEGSLSDLNSTGDLLGSLRYDDRLIAHYSFSEEAFNGSHFLDQTGKQSDLAAPSDDSNYQFEDGYLKLTSSGEMSTNFNFSTFDNEVEVIAFIDAPDNGVSFVKVEDSFNLETAGGGSTDRVSFHFWDEDGDKQERAAGSYVKEGMVMVSGRAYDSGSDLRVQAALNGETGGTGINPGDRINQSGGDLFIGSEGFEGRIGEVMIFNETVDLDRQYDLRNVYD